jgi:tetratricopeptide (TPR) repeat protein
VDFQAQGDHLMPACRIIGVTLVALLLLGYGVSHTRTVRLRAAQPPETLRAQAISLDPTLLKIASGPFKGLVADYLILKASVFMGGTWGPAEEDWETVYILLKQSLHLDPLFFQTGYYVQGLLSWRKGMQEKATELLLYHAERRDWDWEPMFYAGFNYFIYLKDNDKAAEYLQKAANRPGAPVIAGSLSARIIQRGGQTLTAIALLKTILEQAEDDYTRARYTERLDAYLGIHRLEQAIAEFNNRKGRPPNALEELIDTGIVDKLPENPFAARYQYEPETGKIAF